MAKYVMALDAGTTSNRCILFNEKGEMCSVAQREFTQYFPKPGWVEHDADEIWASMLGVAVEAMNMINAEAEDIAIVMSSSSVLSVSATSSALSNVALICSPSSVFISFTKYVLANPINTATIDVKTNTSNIEPIIFPILFGCFIFDIAVVMFKNISGIIITNNRFKNKSPNGLNIVAFSLKIIPMMLPTIIATRSIIVDL